MMHCRSWSGWRWNLAGRPASKRRATALVAMPDRMPPALLVERFDIRESNDDARFLALEDMCSVLDLPTSAKYACTMERVARASARCLRPPKRICASS